MMKQCINVSMSFWCLSVFGWMFEYLPRISLKHWNMILVRIPSPNRNILHSFIIVVICDWIDFFPGSGMVSVWCLFKCSFKFEVDPEYLHSCLHSKQTAKSLHTLVPIFHKTKIFPCIASSIWIFHQNFALHACYSQGLRMKLGGNSIWKYVRLPTNQSLQEVTTCGKRMPNIHIRFEYLTFKKVPANIRTSEYPSSP